MVGAPTTIQESGTGAARRALRDERDQLLRWRRLVRARLDLTVARFAPPRPLGALNWDLRPGAEAPLPDHQRISDILGAVEDEDAVELMHRLRDLDRELARYGTVIDDALDEHTQRLLTLIAALPDVDVAH